jgi:hypothetical protein
MNKIKNPRAILILLFLLLSVISNAQFSVGINHGIHSDVSILELDSPENNKGFLIPRMLKAQRDSIVLPVRGLTIFNLSYNFLEVYSGPIENPSWVGLVGAKGGVGFTGATGPARTLLTLDPALVNVVNAPNASVDGGTNNSANGAQSSALGGNHNVADGVDSSVVVGNYNHAIGAQSVIIGGNHNQSDGVRAAVVGGDHNFATGIDAVVVGGNHNLAEVSRSAVVGGYNNKATQEDAVVLGGYNNTAGGAKSCVLGGFNNTATGANSVVVAGNNNKSIGASSVVVGGLNNTSQGANSVVFAGNNNTALGTASSVSSGSNNIASGTMATVSGGMGNQAKSYGEWVGGLYSSNYLPLSTTGFEATDRLFTIGNGTSDLNRSDALLILKNGLAYLPSVLTDDIASGSVKAIVTKEYINEKCLQFDFNAAIPLSITATGTIGQIRYANNFIYICIATNTWVRKAAATW